MKKIIFFIIILSNLCPSSFTYNDYMFINNNRIFNDSEITENHSADSRNIFKSLILPGWGQYSRGDYKKAFIFLCIESIAVGIYYNYNKKGTDTYALTKIFGDEHWSFSNWIVDYYNFENSEYSYIFEREDSNSYKELWEGGHKIEFFYNGEYYTTGLAFESFYNDILCPSGHGECDSSVFEAIKINKDHHYYENIGKYDHFFAGWDDNEEIEEFIKPSGELIAYSPNKKKYRNDWEASAEFNKIADYALYSIYSNHILSVLDILVFSKINKNSKFKYKLKTVYNPNNKIGLGGITLSIAW